MSTRCLAAISTLMFAASVAAALAGPTNHSLVFDGTDDWVEVADPVNPTTALTLEAWVKMDPADPGGRVLTNRGIGTGYDLTIFDPGTGLALQWVLNTSLVFDVPIGSHVGSWVHVAATWGGVGTGRAKLFVGGTLAGEVDWAWDLLPSAENLRIGKLFSLASHFQGTIDEVRIWDAEVDDATIQTWSTRSIDATHPYWSGLLGYWRFDEGTGQTTASFVNSPALDGTLGGSLTPDSQDPAWDTDAAPLPVEATTFGAIKNAYR